jgi:hypothetical protein
MTKINIKFNKLIDPIFIFYCQNNPALKNRGWNNWVPPTQKEIDERIKGYQNEWEKYEDKILNNLFLITGLNFKEQTIDVHIVSGSPRQISNPLIIKSGFSPFEFVNILTHELIHRLFGFNKINYKDDYLNTKYHNETITTKKHIIIFAILKYIFLDILNEPIRLEKAMEDSKKHDTKEYTRAWEITEEIGYKKIIEDFNSTL